MHACMHTHIRTYAHTYIHTYVRTYAHTYIHTYTHTHTYVYENICICVYIYTYDRCLIRRQVDKEIARGVSLRGSLQQGGRLWLSLALDCNFVGRVLKLAAFAHVHP